MYTSYNVSRHLAQKLLLQLLAPFDFNKQGLLNFDAFLAVRNLLTVGCQFEDVYEAREANKVFMQLAFDTYWIASFRVYCTSQLEITGPQGLLVKANLT